MKFIITLLALSISTYSFCQGYATAGYSLKVQDGPEAHGFHFGAGGYIGKNTVGFNLEYFKAYAIFALDARARITDNTFFAFQPGWQVYKQFKGINYDGRFSWTGLLGCQYKFIVVSAGYQNTGTHILGHNYRTGSFKLNIGLQVH